MESEYGIGGDFEHYDDEKEFRRLVRAVKLSKKHFLYFVCCNQVPKQNELIGAVKKSLGGKKIKVVKFKKKIEDLLTELQKRKFSGECEAIFVQGLEYSISSDGKGSENAVIYNLNISRDSFKKYFSCPVVLWLPEYALIKITRHAPDFFSVRSGTFYFSSTEEKVIEQIFQNFTSGWIEISSLPIEVKLQKIQILENLLREYQGLHQEKRNKATEIRLLSELGSFFSSISKPRKAIDYYEQSLQISREINNRLSECIILNNLGNDYQSLGEYQKAIDYHEQSLKTSREIGDRVGESSSLNDLGTTYQKLGEYQKAIDYHKQSLEISGEIGDRAIEGNNLNNLGIAYQRLGYDQKAIDYHEQSLKLKLKIGDRAGQGNSLNNLGNAHQEIGNYKKAIDYHEQSLNISREIGYPMGEGISLGNLGRAYYNLGEKERACGLWNEAVIILDAIESPYANIVRGNIEKFCGG